MVSATVVQAARPGSIPGVKPGAPHLTHTCASVGERVPMLHEVPDKSNDLFSDLCLRPSVC